MWLGPTPPKLAGDWCDWDTKRSLEWRRVADATWTAELTTAPDAYLEYALFRSHDDRDRVPDPLNRHAIPNGVGQVNHRFWMPSAARPRLRDRRARPAGRLTRHTIEARWLLTTRRRTVELYRPDVPAGPLPLLVVWDGQDFRGRARLPAIVDDLVASGRMAPVALALVASTGGAKRMIEYATNDLTLAFVDDAVLPLARGELELTDPGDGDGWGVLGASMGGLMALYAALRQPQTYRRVLALSGAFELDDRAMLTATLVDHLPPQPIRVWMRSGDYEWLAGAGDRMADRLRARGYEVNAGRYAAGHNYTAWAQVLPDGLAWLFPPDGQDVA